MTGETLPFSRVVRSPLLRPGAQLLDPLLPRLFLHVFDLDLLFLRFREDGRDPQHGPRAKAPQNLVPRNFASERSEFPKSAPARRDFEKSAPIAREKRKSASSRFAPWKFAPIRSVPERSASRARTCERLARFRFACRKLPKERSAREKSLPSACASERSA